MLQKPVVLQKPILLHSGFPQVQESVALLSPHVEASALLVIPTSARHRPLLCPLHASSSVVVVVLFPVLVASEVVVLDSVRPLVQESGVLESGRPSVQESVLLESVRPAAPS